jgi:hypothetical protein
MVFVATQDGHVRRIYPLAPDLSSAKCRLWNFVLAGRQTSMHCTLPTEYGSCRSEEVCKAHSSDVIIFADNRADARSSPTTPTIPPGPNRRIRTVIAYSRLKDGSPETILVLRMLRTPIISQRRTLLISGLLCAKTTLA